MHEHTVEVVEFNICRQFVNKSFLDNHSIKEIKKYCKGFSFELITPELKKAMRKKPLPYNFSDDDLYAILSSQDCGFFTRRTPMGISKKHIYKGHNTHDLGDPYAYLENTKEVFKENLEYSQILINFLEDNFDIYKSFLKSFQDEWETYAHRVIRGYEVAYGDSDDAVMADIERECVRRHKIYKVHFILGVIFFSLLPFWLLLICIFGNGDFLSAIISFIIEPVNIFWGVVVHPKILKGIIFDERHPYDSDVLKGCGFDERKTKGAVLTGAAIGKFLK